MNTATEKLQFTSSQSVEKRRQISLIVSYLMQALNIPDGSHLVLFFGTGHASDNRQALMQWVEAHLDEINPDEAEQRLKRLANRAVISVEDSVCSNSI